jgi:hypothetical protein
MTDENADTARKERGRNDVGETKRIELKNFSGKKAAKK